MSDEEQLETTTPTTGDDNEAFDVFLPVSPTLQSEGATHIARMGGNRAGFMDVLAGFVATGSPLSEPLRSPVDDTSLDKIKQALEGLGPAHVESIESV